MAVTIRLTRAGSKKVPFYRVVAADRAARATDASSNSSASTIPCAIPSSSASTTSAWTHWIKNGAVPSQTVGELLRRQRRAAAAAAKA